MTEIRNMMDFPNEVLGMIFQHLRKQQIGLGQTNKRFYEISCSITDCKMKIDLKSQHELDGMIDSIMNTKRRVSQLEIKRQGSWTRVDKILKKFGAGIRKIRLDHVKITSKELILLNHAHDLDCLELCYVTFEGKIPKNLKLNLSKLNNLEIAGCQEKLLKTLNSLPDDVLTELTLQDIDLEGKQTYFQNQRKLRVLHGNAFLLDYCENTDLESLKIFAETITGEIDEAYITTENLNMICEKLGKLKELEFEVARWHRIDFSAVARLKNIEKLKLTKDRGDFYDDFKTLRSLSIEEIQIFCHDLSGVEYIGLGCPNIRKIKLNGSFPKSSIFDKVLLRFPKLESLDFFSLGFSKPSKGIQRFEHENLKELSIAIDSFFDFEESHPYFKIAKCNKLEKLSFNSKLLNKSLVNLIANQPSLKLLYIYSFVEIKKPYLKNLARVSGHLDGIMINCYNKFDEVFADFEKHFPIVEVKGNVGQQIIFKKNKDVDVSKEF